jgi:hypothetical protein
MSTSEVDNVSRYAISAVRYSASRARIERLRIHAVRPGFVGTPLEITRESFLLAMELGHEFVVLSRGQCERRSRAEASVQLVRVGGVAFFRCDSSGWPADDLATASEF